MFFFQQWQSSCCQTDCYTDSNYGLQRTLESGHEEADRRGANPGKKGMTQGTFPFSWGQDLIRDKRQVKLRKKPASNRLEKPEEELRATSALKRWGREILERREPKEGAKPSALKRYPRFRATPEQTPSSLPGLRGLSRHSTCCPPQGERNSVIIDIYCGMLLK